MVSISTLQPEKLIHDMDSIVTERVRTHPLTSKVLKD